MDSKKSDMSLLRVSLYVLKATKNCSLLPSGSFISDDSDTGFIDNNNKKVLLREPKRHTARHIAIAISCYSGGGGALTKNSFSQSEHVSSQIWCQKIFPLLWGEGGGGRGGPLTKIFFQSEHVSSQIWCQKCFPFTGGGGPLTKIFLPV